MIEIENENELYAALQTLGKDVVMELAQGLVRARKLHPGFAEDAIDAARVVRNEARELVSAAIDMESPDRQHAEAQDTAVTAIRFMKLEWLPKFGAEMAAAGPGCISWPVSPANGEDAPESHSELSEHIVWCEDGAANDPVNHPPHYTSHPSGVECIQITEHMGFCLGNAMKYIWRADLKNGVQDLEKAKWYIEREISKRGA